MHLVSCGFVVWLFCCLGGVFSFNMVAENTGGPAVPWSPSCNHLLLVILGVSMVLHESWILDSSYAAMMKTSMWTRMWYIQQMDQVIAFLPSMRRS